MSIPSGDIVSQMIWFGKSDIGLKRSVNEDAFMLSPEFGFCSVADGIGGASAGEVASRIFIESACKMFSSLGEPSEGGVAEAITRVFWSANEKIRKCKKENPYYKGMGCTAELMAWSSRHITLGHVGDSRTYLYRAGDLRQITRDHTFIQDQVDKKLIDPGQAKKHPLRNVILRAVGEKDSLEVDVIRGMSKSDDIFLVCSDGLTEMVDDAAIREILSLSISLPQKIEVLIELANKAGGNDNITVLLGQVR